MADILTPTLGESVTEATIGKWTKKAGDPVKKDEVLVELETDKVSLEVVSPADGVLSEIKAPDGETVTPGAVLGVVTEGASASAAPVAAAPAEAPDAPKAEAPAAEAAPAPAAAPAAASGDAVSITTPTMGESVAEGTMGTWLKKSGDTVAKDELLVEIETDKVAVEVSAPAAGVLTIVADSGATVTPGQQIGSVSASGQAAAPAPAAAAPATGGSANAGSAQIKSDDQHLSPAVQRVVSENNLDPKAIAATGPKGNITKGDALAAIGAAAPAATPAPAAPAIPRADQPREERVKMTRSSRGWS
ncbi:MAG: dihydrolipoamide succinyltransferase, partial [Brevundimonas sp.]